MAYHISSHSISSAYNIKSEPHHLNPQSPESSCFQFLAVPPNPSNPISSPLQNAKIQQDLKASYQLISDFEEMFTQANKGITRKFAKLANVEEECKLSGRQEAKEVDEAEF